MRAYYEQGKEQDRLAGAKGVLEFERSKEIVQRRLPRAPAAVADIGGGPGRYALWLAEQGYTVQHRDLMELHVDQLRASGNPSIQARAGDARRVDLPDSSVDAVLLLGPLYHLPDREDRIQALKEARRIVRDGGPVFVAAISRWAPRLDGVLQERLYERSPDFPSLLPEIERTGNLPPVVPSGFVGYTHRPGDLVDEIAEAVCSLMTSSAWKVCRWPERTWSPGSATKAPGTCSSTRHERSNEFPSCLVSART